MCNQLDVFGRFPDGNCRKKNICNRKFIIECKGALDSDVHQ